MAAGSLVMWLLGNVVRINDWGVDMPLAQAKDEEDPEEDVTNFWRGAKLVKLDLDEIIRLRR